MRTERPSDKMKTAIRNVFWLYVLLFLAVIGYILYFMAFERKAAISDPHNPRLYVYDNEVSRGDIYDSNGAVIAHSALVDGAYVREYNYGSNMCHLVGYVGKGRSGIEAAYNFELKKLHNEIWQRITQLATGNELKGNSLNLTVNMDIQEAAYNGLGNKKGAVIVMEPDTGKILAMASYPNFNPNTIAESWVELDEDEGGPFLNRASQGLYTPGSVFKIISAATIMENNENYDSIEYNCEGSHTFGDKTIHCFDEKKHGTVNIYDAMAYSCNTFFSEEIYELKAQMLIDSAETRLFNKPLYYPLEYSKSLFQMSSLPTDSEVVETAIGQGRTLVTPLHMSMITSAVVNEGVMMKPYVVDYITAYNGKTLSKNLPKMIEMVFNASEAEELKEMMHQVVKRGTATAADISGVYVAGKTGTAENPNGTAHSWFTSFAEKDGKKVVVTVVLENPEPGQSAVPVAADIIKSIYN